jgi:hypothetical protein
LSRACSRRWRSITRCCAMPGAPKGFWSPPISHPVRARARAYLMWPSQSEKNNRPSGGVNLYC